LNGVTVDAGRPEPGGRVGPRVTALDRIKRRARATCGATLVYRDLGMSLRRPLVAAALALAVAGCPTVDLGDQPPDVGLCNPPGGMPYFMTDVWPKFLTIADTGSRKSNCTDDGCHDLAHGMILDPRTPVDFAKNYRVVQTYLNCGAPETSELLTKPLAGQDAHGGGDIFANESDPAVQTFLGWFQ
jgi:hypothetical protein